MDYTLVNVPAEEREFTLRLLNAPRVTQVVREANADPNYRVSIQMVETEAGPIMIRIFRQKIPPMIRMPFCKEHDKYNDGCSICLETFDDAEIIQQLECKHVFHPKCIGEWLSTNETCPLCRGQIYNWEVDERLPEPQSEINNRKSVSVVWQVIALLLLCNILVLLWLFVI